MDKQRTYYVDFGGGTAYFNAVSESEVIAPDGAHTIPISRLMDFISTARELGFKAGEL